MVDGEVRTPTRCRYVEYAVEYGKIGVRRDHIDSICLKHRAIGCRHDFDLAVPGEQLRQGAGMVRRKVLDHDDRGVDIRNGLYQFLHGLEPTCGGADAYDITSLVLSRLF